MSGHDLVDHIFQRTSCEFLSEMKQDCMHHAVIQAILGLNLSDYALHQWEYALAYIFGEKVQFSSEADVLNYLMSSTSDSATRAQAAAMLMQEK